MAEVEPKRQSASGAPATHRALFFRGWLQDPFHVASVLPSGKWLAKLMTRGLAPGARVVELGAGTGTLTEAILARGVHPEDLYLVERQPDFAELLRQRFPSANLLRIDARSVAESLRPLTGSVDFVVSGLPMLWFDRDTKRQILSGAFELLKPRGSFHQFTYAGRPPIGRRLLESLDLGAELVGISPINVPPAFVYRLHKVAE